MIRKFEKRRDRTPENPSALGETQEKKILGRILLL